MSISTPHTGGSRRPSSKPAAAGPPKPSKGAKSSGSSGGAATSSGAASSGPASPGPAEADSGAKPASGGKGTTGAKAAGAKPAAGAKAASAKSAGAKSASAKSASAKSAAGKSSAGGKPAAEAKAASAAKSTPAAKPAAGARPAGAKATAGRRSSAEPVRPAGKTGGKGPNRPVPPIKVSQGRNWGPIALFSVVGVVALVIIGFGIYAVYQHSRSWQDKADAIPGIVDYRKTEKDLAQPGQHAYGKLTYPQSPPVGGKHNPNWQRCMGDVYTDQIPSENAVHALEHGAVWITYRPDLPKDQVEQLAAKVRGNDFMLMSPYPGLDKPISLQAWGFQLKVDKASDSRIDDFIKDLRINASMEPGAVCSSGNYTTKTGSDPVNLGQDVNPSGTM